MGVPKSWDDSKKNLSYIRSAGTRQFVSTYNRVKDLKGDELMWGDEIEYGVFQIDPETKKVRLSLRAKEVGSNGVAVVYAALLMLFYRILLTKWLVCSAFT